jgi:hypothetical protein
MIQHGIELDENGKPIWLRFGLLRLMHHLVGLHRADAGVPSPLSLRFRRPHFLHIVGYLQACFWKFDRAAGDTDRCRAAIQRWVEFDTHRGAGCLSVHDPEFEISATYSKALADLPLHLDSMLFYL